MNYNRKGISYQLGIEVKKYSLADLDTLDDQPFRKSLNEYADAGHRRTERFIKAKKKICSGKASLAYQNAAKKFSFLAYQPASIKPSLFSYAGNYLGFQGYYNPFSGEAQVNTTIPRFLEPFVTVT